MNSRTGNFASGAIGPSEPSSLQQASDNFNAKNPRNFRPNSVLQPYMLSPNNGNSARDASRQTPNGQLPSPNGMSQSTYQLKDPQMGMNLSL